MLINDPAKSTGRIAALRCMVPKGDQALKERLMAVMLDFGFEGFLEDDHSVTGYIPEEKLPSPEIADNFLPDKSIISVEYQVIEPRNWNEEWERSFKPLIIKNQCLIRAPFHPVNLDIPVDVIIEPRMAFGTGHHPTTEMIAGYLLCNDIGGKKVFDMGCGTGILGIISMKRGAGLVEMADIDPVAVENTLHNCTINGVSPAGVFEGGIETLKQKRFDLITANINKPVLINHMADYYEALNSKGLLLASGILEQDEDEVMQASVIVGFTPALKVKRKGWLLLVLSKSEAG